MSNRILCKQYDMSMDIDRKTLTLVFEHFISFSLFRIISCETLIFFDLNRGQKDNRRLVLPFHL